MLYHPRKGQRLGSCDKYGLFFLFITQGDGFLLPYMLYPSGLLQEPEIWWGTVEKEHDVS